MKSGITAVVFLIMLASFGLTDRSSAGSDGLLSQPWFKHSNLDLRKDLSEANADGKILAILFEQQGYVYCQQMYDVNFKEPEIVNFITGNFSVVQLDFRSHRSVTDTVGITSEERLLARTYQVNGTLNIVFIDETGKQVYRMPGYAPPALFLAVFEFVKEKAYRTSTIQAWYREHRS